MKSLIGIKEGIKNGDSVIDISRKIFLSYPSYAFVDKEEIEFAIKNSIKNYLKVPFISVQVAGSAKTGYSFVKRTEFNNRTSDLDIAIINIQLYNKFMEIAHIRSKGFTDLGVFPVYQGKSTAQQFSEALASGFINPFFLPNCTEKNEWLDFFRNLSNKYIDIFAKISGGIYASEYFFEHKQKKSIEQFKNNKEK